MPLKLIIANKAYSSWSLRPWILLAHFHIPFEEVVIPMDQPETRARMLEYSPTGKCPSLRDGAVEVWESLAILEYIAEQYPEKAIWPQGEGRASACPLARQRDACGFPGAAATLPDPVHPPGAQRSR